MNGSSTCKLPISTSCLQFVIKRTWNLAFSWNYHSEQEQPDKPSNVHWALWPLAISVTKIQPYISRKYRCPIVELPCNKDTPASYSIPKQPEKTKRKKKTMWSPTPAKDLISVLSHFSCKNVQIKGGSNPQPQSEWSSKICCSRTGWCWQTWKKTRKPLPPVPLQTLTAVLLFATVNISNKHEQGRSALSLLMQCDAYQHSWYTERDRNFCSDASSLLM